MANFFVDLAAVLAHVAWDIAVSLKRILYRPQCKDVSGRTVVITGAGSGLGQLVSIKLAKLGANVVGWDINEAGLQKTEKLIQAETESVYASEDTKLKRFRYRIVDITKREDVYAAAKEEGKVDILINNAGIVTQNGFLQDKCDEGIVKTFEVNTISHFWTVKAFLPGMMDRNSGHIVTIASLAGYNGSPRLTDYCSSKFAAIGFHECLQYELEAQGYGETIQATLVNPYIINTGMFHGSIENRISFLVPILEPDRVACSIVDGILTNEKIVIVPRISTALTAVKFVLPVEAWSRVVQFCGMNELFTNLVGRSQKND